jgi:hypothetical protein
LLSNDLLEEIARQEQQDSTSTSLIDRVIQHQTDPEEYNEVVDILEYVRAEWGLNENPFPIQRFILKLIFGLPLDDRPDDVIEQVLSPTQFICSRPHQFRRSRYVNVGLNSGSKVSKINVYRRTVTLDWEPPYPLKVGDWVTSRIEVWDRFRENLLGTYTEAEFFDFIYGDGPGSDNCRISLSREEYNQRLGKQMNLVIARLGRRAGKTSIGQMIAGYFCYRTLKKYNPQEYYQVRRDQAITMTLMATSKDQAQDLLAPARASIRRTPYMRRFLGPDSVRRLVLTTAYNIDHALSYESGIKITAIPCSAKSARGPANILAILEEFGFFYFELKGSNKSDKEIYAALAPSTSDLCNPDTGEPEGLIFIPSTPLTTESYMHEIEETIWERKTDMLNSLVIHLPSYWANPLISGVKLKEIYALDPATFSREYDADYTEQLETALKRDFVELCRQDPVNCTWKTHGEELYMGFDMGMVKDWTVISIAALNAEGIARLVHHEPIGFKQTPGWEEYIDETTGNSLCIVKIARRVDELWIQWGVRLGLGDQHNSFGLKSHLKSSARENLDLMEMTAPKNDHIARNFLAYIQLRKLIIYEPYSEWHNPQSLLRELSRLKKLQTGGSVPKIKLIAPKIEGAHDDQYSAVSRAIYVGQRDISENPPSIHQLTRQAVQHSKDLRERMTARTLTPASVRVVRPTGRRFS